MTHCRKAGSRPKIAYVLTSSASVHFLVGQVEFLVKHGFDVNVISGSGRELEEIGAEGGVPFVLEMEREIAPFQDFVALCKLWRHFRATNPDIVVAGTP